MCRARTSATARRRVLILGGVAQSIGVYAAGLAVWHGAADIPQRDYDIAVEELQLSAGVQLALRSLAPGGTCQPVGYYLPRGTKVPLMHMYANDATLKIGVCNIRPVLPELLDFIDREDFRLNWSPPRPPTGRRTRVAARASVREMLTVHGVSACRHARSR